MADADRDPAAVPPSPAEPPSPAPHDTSAVRDKTPGPGAMDAFLAIRPNNRYKILHYLAAGSFGKIFQGVSMQSGDDVAVKFVCGSWFKVSLFGSNLGCKGIR